jgi:sulfur relay (sulfurtransferase) DsrC/TusE family protein
MNKYFKFSAESDLGIGVQYIEFDEDNWPIRQAECYEDRWFNSNRRYHPELGGMGLCDQQLKASGMKIGISIDQQEFEEAWKLSNKQSFREKALEIHRKYYLDGALSAAAKSLLKKIIKDLGLDQASAQKILLEFEEHQEQVEEYRSAFVTELSDQLEFSPQQRRLLQELQAALGLDDAEIQQIEAQKPYCLVENHSEPLV